MEIIIKNTEKADFYKTENLTREAFWNLFKPGCDEHLVLNQLRKSKNYVAELDFVATLDDDIIGHIISTKAFVVDKNDYKHEVLCVGPFAVLPTLQNKGIGSKLFKHSISKAKKMGFKTMILFGNPDYYHRFGFVNSKVYEISTKDNLNFEPFMALELLPNALENIKGRFFEDDGFITNEKNLIEFEKQFPAKEKGKPKIDLSQMM
ncbi:MAG: N-acetyltransferase [Bacteroidales bacterium]|nr:N-acetyltransferase [Bacteroidales bacterium]